MRIALISGTLPPAWSPEGDHALHLCAHLAAKGCEISVLTTQGNRPPQLPAGVEVDDSMQQWAWAELPRLVGFLRQAKPDVVFLHYIGTLFDNHAMITFAPTITRFILGRVPFVTQITNAIGAKPARSYKSRLIGNCAAILSGGADDEFGSLLNRSHQVIVFSEHHLRKLEKRQSGLSKRAVLIPPPPILNMSPNDGAVRCRMRQRLGVADNEWLIGNFGYGYEGKGLETLIGAFAIVAKRRQDCKLVLIGRITEDVVDGGGTFKERILRLIAESGCKDRILLTGGYDADSDEGSAYLRAIDICVLPLDVGIQLNNSSLAAALAHGLPIVATRQPCLERPFIDEQNVLLSPPKDCAALAANIERTLDDQKLRDTLTSGAVALSQAWFSWENVIEKTMSAIDTATKLCGGKRGKRA
jgi:glycosyltransferase involved in cell wall biosynthesis